MLRKLSFAIALTMATLAGMMTAHAEGEQTADPALAAQYAAEDPLALWGRIYEVFSHPRCANCHVGEDNRPRWSGPSFGLEDGDWDYHGMNINGGIDRFGARTVPCTACHQQTNSPVPHGPPGAVVWMLAPVEMEWFGKSSEYICAQIKDVDRNGGRSLEEVAAHIDHDALVHWGWNPGPGREPAPYSAPEVVAMFNAWAAAGAPCPVAP